MGAAESTAAGHAAPSLKTLTIAPPPYSREVPDTRTSTRGPVHKTDVKPTWDPNSTLYTNLLARKLVDPDGTLPLFGTRKIDPATGEAGPYEWINMNEFLADVDACASGMKNLLHTERGALIGLFSKNRYEWCLVEHASNRMAYTLVPLYDTLGPNAIPFIMNHTEMKVVFCAKEQFKTLMGCIDQCPTVKMVVQFEDDVDDEEIELSKQHNVQLLTLSELMKAGKENIVLADPPKPEDISTICYTSGTTGDPKGVMLTHANFAAEAIGYDFVTSIYPSDVYIAYLPLAHVYERSIHAKVIKDGGRIGFYQGDVAKIVDDMIALQPTIFVTVPRLLNRIYDKISHGVASASSIKRALFGHAYKSKENHLTNGGHLTHGLWDPVVFGKFQALMGGRMRLIINGSAPITKEVKQFYQIVFACTVLEGYGLTETCAAFTCSTVEMPVGNHVGVPLPGLEARLEDVPEMNYTSNDSPKPRGEILLRGASVFKGYYKQPEMTAQAMDEDGWFHTGDIGSWNEDGTLSIIDRKKNIFKLQQGEYIAPEKIEAIYCKSRFVAQAFVHGDSHKSYLVGVVVPNEHAIEHWLEEQQASGKATSLSSAASSSSDSTGGSYTLEQLCQDPDVQRAVAADLEEIGKQFKLFRFERVQKIHLTPEPFALENDLLTPTFKLKRPQLKEFFQTQINHMYEELK